MITAFVLNCIYLALIYHCNTKLFLENTLSICKTSIWIYLFIFPLVHISTFKTFSTQISKCTLLFYTIWAAIIWYLLQAEELMLASKVESTQSLICYSEFDFFWLKIFVGQTNKEYQPRCKQVDIFCSAKNSTKFDQ